MARLNHVAITRRRQTALAALAATTSAHMGRRWNAMRSYDEADQAAWAADVAPVVEAAQTRAIDTQAAYLAARLDDQVIPDTAVALERSRVDLREPFIALANALSKGENLDAAVLSGLLRAQGVGESSVFWAARAANTTIDDSRIHGWTRTLTGNACSWCIQVAAQTYKTAETASFGHQRCDCGVDPIIGDSNPGRLINDALSIS